MCKRKFIIHQICLFLFLFVGASLAVQAQVDTASITGWTYRIMAEELAREGRVNAARLNENTIADPRDYLYAEIYGEMRDAAVAVETGAPDGTQISSDGGNESLRVNRSGYVRIALRLPPELLKKSPLSLAVRCHKISTAAGKKGVCRNVNLIKIVRLDANYYARETKIKSKPRTVKAGEAVKFTAAF